MASVGEEISNPAARMRMRFTETAASSGGELLEVEATYEPGSVEPLEHHHPAQDEHFEIRAGTMRVRLGGGERDVAAGETLDVPRGTVHAMWNPGQEPAVVLWQTRPALRTEEFFELVGTLAASGELTASGARNVLKGAAVMHAYRDVFVPADPPAPVRAIAFPTLALGAWLLGQDPTRRRP